MDYRQFLKREFGTRSRAQEKYSLRSFARDLGLAPSRLSEILNHKQGLSFDLAQRVGEKLGLNDRELELFCHLVESEHARSQVKRELAKTRVQNIRLSSESFLLSMDTFQFV